MRLIALLLVLALAGCATMNNPISQNSLANIEATYGVALSAANAYRNLPLCKTGTTTSLTNVCARRSIVVKIQSAVTKAQAADLQLRAFVKNNPTLDASSLISALQSAVAFLQSIETSNGVK